MKTTENYGFNIPEKTDFVEIRKLTENWEKADEELGKLEAPEFEDFTGGTEVPSAATALEALKSKIHLPLWMSNVVAFCKGCVTLAMLVNDTATNNTQLPVSSAVTHDLQKQLNVLNTNLTVGRYRLALNFGNTVISSNSDGTFQLVHGSGIANAQIFARFGGSTQNYITFGGNVDENSAYGVIRNSQGEGIEVIDHSILWLVIGFKEI